MIFKPQNVLFEIRKFSNEIQHKTIANLWVTYYDGEIEKEAVFKIENVEEIENIKKEAVKKLKELIESI